MIKKKKLVHVASVFFAMSIFCMGCKSTPVNEKTETEKTPAKTSTKPAEKTEQKQEQKKEMNVQKTDSDFEQNYKKSMSNYRGHCDNYGSVLNITYYSSVMDSERKAQIYLPYDYDENKSYPIMYLIHGIGCDSSQWVSMNSANIFDVMISRGDLKPFIAVYPSVIPKNGLDKVTLSDTNIQAFKDFVQEIKADLHPFMLENFGVSDKREDTAICGLSMGGMEALRVGFTYLDMFDYIGSFSAAPTLEMNLLTTAGSEYVPSLVLICSGDRDGTVGNNPMNYHLELQKNGVEHLWYQHPGGGHDPNVWNLGLVNFLERLGGGFIE